MPLIEKKYKITDFMTIIDQETLQVYFTELEVKFKKEKLIDGNKLIFLIFNYIKNRLDFKQILSIFSKH